MKFTKMQALGNDFVALNGFSQPERDWRALSIAMCDRHFGVGADGLFVALPSDTADARMLFFNPDGTEDRCGNGLRCFGRYLHDEGITDKRELVIETYGGPVDLQVETKDGTVGNVTVDLGPPILDAPRIPLNLPPGPALDVPLEIGGTTYRIYAVSTGTPHAVILVDRLPDEHTFQTVSPQIETHPIFPEKTSVMWTRFTAPERAEVRIWERATGETLGCGTGAAAVVVIGRILNITPGIVTVVSKGGEVLTAWYRGTVTLTGPATTIFTGEWPE